MKCQNKECRKSFSPKYTNIIYCSYECGKIIAKERNSKKLVIKKTTKTKEKTKTQYKDDLQILINKCIHIIDKGMNCITCDQQFKGKLQPQAGHYNSRGSFPEFRFNPHNIHLQCNICNENLGGQKIEFQKGLQLRYGSIYWSFVHYEMEAFSNLQIFQLKELIEIVTMFIIDLQDFNPKNIDERLTKRGILLDKIITKLK